MLSSITKSKTYRRSAFTRQQHGLHSIHLMPFQFIQMPTGEAFLLHLQTMYKLWKHKLCFPSDVHKEKNTNPQCCLLSHSSVMARLTTMRSGKTQYPAKLSLLLPLLYTDCLSSSPTTLHYLSAFYLTHYLLLLLQHPSRTRLPLASFWSFPKAPAIPFSPFLAVNRPESRWIKSAP